MFWGLFGFEFGCSDSFSSLLFSSLRQDVLVLADKEPLNKSTSRLLCQLVVVSASCTPDPCCLACVLGHLVLMGSVVGILDGQSRLDCGT